MDSPLKTVIYTIITKVYQIENVLLKLAIMNDYELYGKIIGDIRMDYK